MHVHLLKTSHNNTIMKKFINIRLYGMPDLNSTVLLKYFHNLISNDVPKVMLGIIAIHQSAEIFGIMIGKVKNFTLNSFATMGGTEVLYAIKPYIIRPIIAQISASLGWRKYVFFMISIFLLMND